MNDEILEIILKSNEGAFGQLSIDDLVTIIDLIDENDFETAKGSNGKSVILELFPRDHVELAQRMRNKTQLLSIDEAVTVGNIDLVRELLIEDPNLIKFESSFEGFTPLHLASGFSASLDMVELLVENGADLESYSSGDRMNSIPPIISATLGGNHEIVAYLIERGVNTNAEEKGTGLTSFEIAKKNNRYDIVDLFGAHAKPTE